VVADAQVRHEGGERVGDRGEHDRLPDDEEEEAGRRREDEGDDLIRRQGGEPQPQGEVGSAEQERAEVAADHRAIVRVAERDHRDGERQGAEQRGGEEAERGEELPDDDLPVLDREGEEQLRRAELPLLRPQPHGHRRDEEEEDQRDQGEELPQGRLSDDEEAAEEEEMGQHEEDGDEDVGDGGLEVAAEFLPRDRHHSAHERLSPMVSWRKTCSRLRWLERSSVRIHPLSTASRKMSSAISWEASATTS